METDGVAALPVKKSGLWTAKEVAAEINMSPQWVRSHATRREPRIPVVRLGRRLRFHPEAVAAFVRRCEELTR